MRAELQNRLNGTRCKPESVPPGAGAYYRFAIICLTLFLLIPSQAQDVKRSAPSAWEASVVTVEVARKQYDYYQPWTKKTARAQKPALVIGERELLTTAEELFDRTLVRLQKYGRGRWFQGEVSWIDYHANLALLTCSDAEFWRDLKPAKLNGTMPPDGNVQIVRWRGGNLESRRAEFTQFAVREGQLAAVNHVVLEADSDIHGAGWGGQVPGKICEARPS